MFIPNAMETQLILQSMLHGNKKNDTAVLVWTPETEKAFFKFKNMLVTTTLLAYPVQNAKLILAVDASDKCIGATINQLFNNQLQPLDSSQERYPIVKQSTALTTENYSLFMLQSNTSNSCLKAKFSLFTPITNH